MRLPICFPLLAQPTGRLPLTALFVPALLVIASVAFAPAADAADEDETAVEDDSVWVTSIAPLDGSGSFVASTAQGLLLREAEVVRFSADDPTELTPLYTHPAAVWQVVVLDGGQRVASVDYRGNLVVYDVETQQADTHEEAFERWCQAMIASPDGKSLIAGNEAGVLFVWDVAGGEVAKKVEVDQHAVTGLALSPDASQLAVSDGAGHVHLFAWPSLEAAGKITVGEDAAWCVAYTQDGESLVVGSADRKLYRCEAKADAEPQEALKGSDWITEIAANPAGDLAVGEIGGNIRFPDGGEAAASLTAPSGVWALCWNGGQELLVGTRKDGIVAAGRAWKWGSPPESDDDE